MKLHVVSSSSSGNAYALEDEQGRTLLIEAGCPLVKLVRHFDIDLMKCDGLLISHEHGDHAKYADEYARSGVQVYASPGTIEALKERGAKDAALYLPIDTAKPALRLGFHLGSIDQVWRVRAFHVVHDAAEPVGFLINHVESGNILFLTDTHYLNARFKDLNKVLIETNYCEDILAQRTLTGQINPTHAQRVTQSHMSLQTAARFLEAQDLTAVTDIVLLHLSDTNSHSRVFAQTIESATGKTVHVADKIMTIPLNPTPF